MKALDWFNQINALCQFHSIERPGTKASQSEIRRWFQNKAIIVNGESIALTEDVDFHVFSIVLFPKGNRRTTLK